MRGESWAAKALQASHQPPPAKPPTGLKPLCDMTAEDRYKSRDGGLYGGGKNEPPEKHLQAAMKQAKTIQPLDAEGKPSDDGKIVLISVGMSNTTQEFSQFITLANVDPEKSPKVVIVDGAQGGQTSHAGDQKQVDDPADQQQPCREEPDRAGDRLAEVEPVSAHESEDPEDVADEDGVGFVIVGHL
jgi:hypothetical protein